MNTMNTKTKLMNKICAILLIVAIMVSNFWLVGEVAVSYAIDMAKTSSNNVELAAYFIDENNIETENKNKYITEEDESLYVKVSVKNEGYFSGVLKFENSNFEIDKDFLDEGVQEITKLGEVILKQINAGTDEVIELKVKPIKKKELKLTELQGETTIKLEGEYTNSKNVEKDKVAKVEGETKVTLNWMLPEESALELTGEVFTNKEYELEGENKKVVQFLVESKITEENYAIKTNEICLNKLEGVEEVFIDGRELEERNRELSFEEDEEKVTIKIENIDDEKIIWDEKEVEQIVVTYILDETADTIDKNIKIDGKVETYDGKELVSELEINTEEEKEGIITYEIESKDEIYKGKIQTGEGKEFNTEIKVNVNYEKLVEEIELTEEASKYKEGEEEKEANIVFKETKINKEDFVKLFGDEGYLNLIDENENVIANINKDADEDEEGNIVIKYAEGIKQVQIKTSKPETKGTLKIENRKEIKKEEYSREEINALTAIEEKVSSKEEEVKEEIELKNTESEVKFEANVETLSTLETNKNVKFAVTLLNNDETKDLYQNPKIRITFPDEVKNVNAKCKLFYGNGLILGKTALLQENGKNVIEINLEGVQRVYNAEEVKGTTVIIYTELELDKLAVNTEEKIILNYTNEIATSYKDEGKQELPIKIEGKEGVITTNNIEEYEVRTIGNEGTKKVNIDQNTKKEVSVKISAINNEETVISDIKLLGQFPTKEDDNLGIILRSGIEVINQDNVKVYYSDKEDPTDDLENKDNGWSETGNALSTKSYLIVAENIGKGDKIEAKYDISLPNELPSNGRAKENYSVSYIDIQSGEKKKKEATTIEVTSPVEEKTEENTDEKTDEKVEEKAEDKLDVKIKEFIGNDTIEEGKENQPVTKGEIIRYQVELTNISGKELRDVKVIETAPLGATGLDYVEQEPPENEEEEGMGYGLKYFIQLQPEEVINDYDAKNEDVVDEGELLFRTTKTISSIAPNETKKINFYIRPDDVEGKLTTDFKAEFEDKEISKSITNPINNSEIKVMLEPGHAGAAMDYLVGGNQYMYELTLENYIKNNTKDVNIQVITNDMFDINCIAYDKGEEAVVTYDTKKVTIPDLGETNGISNSTKVRIYAIPKEDISKNNIAQIYAKVSYGDTVLRSNKFANRIKVQKITLTAETVDQGGYKSVGDNIEYKFTLKNDENSISVNNISLKETFSSYIDINEVLVNGQILSEDNNDYNVKAKFENVEEDVHVASETEDVLSLTENLKPGETKEIVVKATVNELAGRRLKEGDKILAKMVASDYEGVIAEGEELNHVFKSQPTDMPDYTTKIKVPATPTIPSVQSSVGNENEAEKVEEQNNTEQNETEEQNKQDQPNNEKEEEEKTYSISGTAWFDEDENGGREDNEQKLSGINVKLLNLVTNESKDTVTSDDGTYSITGVEEGKYVVMFEYDTEKYMLTNYQADGIRENRNSDVENVTMKLDGVDKRVPSTDTLEVTDGNITDVDIGLMEAKVFDLELEKTISKLSVINNEGTKTLTYDGETFAKTDINGRYIEGSTVVIEYKIKVKNTGEIEGYAKSIVDYKPADLQFDSELNSGWYQSGNNIYSNSLSSTKIAPGETKELTLVLTKTMTDSNIGLINNLAEIAESYNTAGMEDIDSISENKQRSEDDLGSCNLSIGIKTGTTIGYITFTISVFTILVAGAYLINRIIIKRK